MGINASGCVQRTCEKAITLVYPVCTALDVIANNDKDVEQVHYNTCIPWYRENCRVFESSRDLVNC